MPSRYRKPALFPVGLNPDAMGQQERSEERQLSERIVGFREDIPGIRPDVACVCRGRNSEATMGSPDGCGSRHSFLRVNLFLSLTSSRAPRLLHEFWHR